jgi:hypothetical protein
MEEYMITEKWISVKDVNIEISTVNDDVTYCKSSVSCPYYQYNKGLIQNH